MSSPLDHLSTELRLLFASARAHGGEELVREALSQPIDWTKLLVAADRERATPAVWKAVSAVSDYTPPKEAGIMQNVTMVTEFRMFHLEQHLKKLIGILSGMGIDTLLLKGAGLGLTHYDSLADRPMVDLDILVPESRAKDAWNAMRDRGWVFETPASLDEVYDKAHHHLPPLLEPSGTQTTLEVHLALHPRNSPILMPPKRVWERAMPINVDGHPSRVPCTVDQIIHLSTHFAWSHALDSAGWRTFRDLDRIWRQDEIDEKELIVEAEKARATSCCYWTLRLGRTLVGLPASDDLLRALRPPRLWPFSGALERAFTFAMMPDVELASPSVSLSRAVWSAGMKPRWSGHGEIRPWHFSDLFVDETTTVHGASKFVQQWRSIPHWGRYLSRLAF